MDVAGLNAGKKGIIIVQNAFGNEQKSTEKTSITTHWRNINNDKYFTIDNSNSAANMICLFCSHGIFNYKTKIYFVEPGIYSLTDIIFIVGNTTYKANTADGNLPPAFMFFEVKGGEVVYIGKILATDKVRVVANSVNIQDDYDAGVKQFKRSYPRINKKPIKRLIRFNRDVLMFKKASKKYGFFSS